jgi:hypothetical protein
MQIYTGFQRLSKKVNHPISIWFTDICLISGLWAYKAGAHKAPLKSYLLSLFCSGYFEDGKLFVQASLESWSPPSQPLKYLELQACATDTRHINIFILMNITCWNGILDMNRQNKNILLKLISFVSFYFFRIVLSRKFKIICVDALHEI